MEESNVQVCLSNAYLSSFYRLSGFAGHSVFTDFYFVKCIKQGLTYDGFE